MGGHPTTPVTIDGRQVDIDVEIAPLIEVLDAVGITTCQSCQNYGGTGNVWLVLASVLDLGELLSAVGQPSEDPESIFQRLADHEVAAPYWPDAPDRWRYALGPIPLDEDEDAWPLDWDFGVTVEFPRADLAEVTALVQKYAALLGKVETVGLPDPSVSPRERVHDEETT